MAQIIQFPPKDDDSFDAMIDICKELALSVSDYLDAYERGCDKVDFTEKVFASSGKLHALIQAMALHAQIWKQN